MDTPGSGEGSPLLIVGLGNVLLMDDGVGVHAVRALQLKPPAGSQVVEVGTAVLDALDLLEAADLVLALDAIQSGGTPGTIYRLDPAGLELKKTGTSLHELDLLAALRMLPADKRPRVIVLGVEPARIDYGLELTPEVAAALPEFLDVVQRVAAEELPPAR